MVRRVTTTITARDVFRQLMPDGTACGGVYRITLSSAITANKIAR